MDQIVETIIFPWLKDRGYNIRKTYNRQAWYLTNQSSGNIYVLLHNGIEWHVNEASGNPSEREELEKKIRGIVSDAETASGSDSDSETGDKTNG